MNDRISPVAGDTVKYMNVVADGGREEGSNKSSEQKKQIRNIKHEVNKSWSKNSMNHTSMFTWWADESISLFSHHSRPKIYTLGNNRLLSLDPD